jgi:hypothetical protein
MSKLRFTLQFSTGLLSGRTTVGDVACMLTGTVFLLTTSMQDFPGTIFTK